MHREGSFIPGKSTVILPTLPLGSFALGVAFGRSPQMEPLGLLGFALFCLCLAALVRSISRLQQGRRTFASNIAPGDLHPSTAATKFGNDMAREATGQVAG